MKKLLLNVLLTMLRWLVYVKRALIKVGVWLTRLFWPIIRGLGKYLVFPLYALVVRGLRRFSRQKDFQGSGSSYFVKDRLGLISLALLMAVLFVGDSYVFAGEPVRGDVLLLELFPANRYGEHVIGQIIEEDEELGAETLPIDEELPFGGTVAGGRAIITPTTLPGAPEEGERRSTATYIVKAGDTVGAISERFGVSVNTVLWENNLRARSRIRPGDVLKILPTSGVKHKVKKGESLNKISKKYGVESEKIRQFNRLDEEAQLAIGDGLIIPGGKPLASPVSRRTSFALRAPVSVARAVDAGTELLWPTAGRVITQYYHSRHSGLDVDGHYQTPIYASEDGVVKVAGWNRGGYGNYIIIDHGGGLRTLYAHASKVYVKRGDPVKRGDIIAMVGTTGRSTGTHLHYEVRVGNRRVNPLRYIR